MKVPTSIARSLLAYIRAGGPEVVKAETMLNAMGWLSSGERAEPDVTQNAKLAWSTSEAKQEELTL